MNNTYSPWDNSRPTLRGLLGQPECSMRWILTLLCVSRVLQRARLIGDPSSTKMTSKSSAGIVCLEGRTTVETVTGGEGRHNDADFQSHPPSAARNAGHGITGQHRTGCRGARRLWTLRRRLA